MSNELPFEPMPFLKDPHYQTIANAFFGCLTEPYSETTLLSLEDGDKLALEVTTPPSWKKGDLIVLLIHGLCGSHRSVNLVRMVKRLEPLGVKTVRFNMRGCGSGRGLAKKGYHSGKSDDLFEALKFVKKESPDSPIVLIGFSLGANITLKLVGELNHLGNEYLKGAIAVSPPVDLYSSIQLFSNPENEMYESYFYNLMRNDVHYRHKKFKDLPPIRLPKKLKLYEFDQIYVAPTSGFASAIDYYNRCSSINFVDQIEVPCKILLAKDDPIVAHSSLDNMSLPSNVEVFKTNFGGHMGYVGHPLNEKGTFWLDSQILDWIHEFL